MFLAFGLMTIEAVMTIVIVAGNENAHDFFTIRDYCNIVSTRTYEFHFNLIKLRCKWNAFVDSFNQSSRFFLRKQQPESGKLKKLDNYYDLEFYLETYYSRSAANSRNKRVFKDLFKNFYVKSLKLSYLNLEEVEEDAFADKSTFKFLEV